jgi:tyrosinase
VRKNVEALTPEELRRLRGALATMKSYDSHSRDERSFAYWARIHANNCQHGWEEFLSWHRFYLHYFEQQLQDIDPSVTLPYWDWSSSYAVNRTVNTLDGGTIPEAFCCFVDDSVIGELTGKVPAATLDALKTTLGKSYGSGPRLFAAADITYDGSATTDAILAALGRANPLWHRFRWPGGKSTSDHGLLFEDYPSPEDIENILGLDGFFAFGSGPDNNHFFGAVENVHNLMHNFSGGNNPSSLSNEPRVGDMVNSGVTAFDPIFWSHHTNIDRLWAEWQKRHPGQVPDDLSAILAPWPGNVGDTLRTAAFGYDYALSTHTFATDPSTSMVRFKSAMAEVPARVIELHRRAEVHLTKVQHMQKGGIVRVFMNQPDADAGTPTRGNDHFVGQMHMFAAECIGGPGHCDVPPETTRKFDTRPRHRKTPHNIRFDATKTIEKLRAAGETDFHVQVVAIDTRGTPSAEVLRLDGVTLVFFD